MALTPEDVVKKTFQPTKFREGYDQDEVDDFLDEVVGELRRLVAEADGLRERLAACEARGGGATPAPVDGEAPGATASLMKQGQQQGGRSAGRLQPAAVAATPEPAAAMTAAPAAAAGGSAAAGAASVEAPQAATGMLALAQRLHDEHVRSGEEQRDRMVADARARAQSLVTEAEEHKTQTLGSLEQERSLLERKIDELRSFERDYRTRLKAYLETQLRDLDSKAAVVTGSADGTPGRA